MADIVKAKVFRYNPSVDPKPYYETYEVPWVEFMSVLELLRYIHENIEPISYIFNCGVSCCGLCSIQVNGLPALACVVAVPNGDILLEPLAGFRVVKDLIVDKTEVENRLYGIRPWFSRAEPMTEPLDMPNEAYVKVKVLQECKSCLCCHSVCPVLTPDSPFYKGFQAFAGPFILTQLAMRYYDTREDLADERLKTAVLEGLFNCTLCGLCDQVCPSGKLIESPGFEHLCINHVKTFKDMMDAAEAKGWKP
jgi:fumarate reductase (CoM/CoB) subunit B